MSRSLALAHLWPIISGIACGLALAPAAACHHRTPVPDGPSASVNADAGYGQRSAERTGSAVQSVSGDEVLNRRVQQVEELLVGRFPGVHVHPTPSGGFSIRVRGGSTPGNGEPLYVIDGMAVVVEPGRGIDWLAPADVARIVVLKNAAETSMYGGRGANGVILITTKRSARRPPRP